MVLKVVSPESSLVIFCSCGELIDATSVEQFVPPEVFEIWLKRNDLSHEKVFDMLEDLESYEPIEQLVNRQDKFGSSLICPKCAESVDEFTTKFKITKALRCDSHKHDSVRYALYKPLINLPIGAPTHSEDGELIYECPDCHQKLSMPINSENTFSPNKLYAARYIKSRLKAGKL